jgi:metallo-beta-lactamase class B
MPRRLSRLKSRYAIVTAAAIGGAAMLAPVQQVAAQALKYSAQATFPKENRAEVARQLAAGMAIARDDLRPDFNWRCMTSPLDRELVSGVQHDGLVPATKLFDNFYSIGQNAVSAFALDTSDGIIIIDSLNNADEAREILVPNLVQMGLDPKRIKYVIITHGHGDHWGGAQYLQQTYGAKVAESQADWEMIERPATNGAFAKLTPPKRDIVVKDGDTITLGNTQVKLYITPGHTPGALSMMFPVYDHGVRHMAGLMGGTGGGQNVATWRQQVASLQRWGQLTRAARVDVLVTNHPVHMQATEKQVLMRYGATGGHNPYIYGVEKYQRYMRVMGACSRVALARLGEVYN